MLYQQIILRSTCDMTHCTHTYDTTHYSGCSADGSSWGARVTWIITPIRMTQLVTQCALPTDCPEVHVWYDSLHLYVWHDSLLRVLRRWAILRSTCDMTHCTYTCDMTHYSGCSADGSSWGPRWNMQRYKESGPWLRRDVEHLWCIASCKVVIDECIYVYSCVHICMYTYIHVCMYAYMYICVICMFTCM